MALEITLETILIFAAFVIVVFTLYRMLKLILRASLIAIASFSFPWVMSFLGFPLPLALTIETGLKFAILGVSLFLIYEFFHFIVHIFKIITLPFKLLFRKKK